MNKDWKFRRPFRVALRFALVSMFTVSSLASGAFAQESTPVGASSRNHLVEMLSLAPDVLATGEREPTPVATFADIAAQSAIAGLKTPTSTDDPEFNDWLFSLSALWLPNELSQYATMTDWRVLVGFALPDVDEFLEVGAAPYYVHFYRGRFDLAKIELAWSTQGYKLLEIEGITVASLHEDIHVDFESDLGRFSFANFNNAAFLPDGTLAYTSTLEQMREVVAIAKGEHSSLADRADVAALLSRIEKPLASAALLTGATFRGLDFFGLVGTPGAIETEIAAASAMPPITMALVGVTPGGPIAGPGYKLSTPQPEISRSMFDIAILLPTRPLAETAEQVVTHRLETASSPRTKQLYSKLFETRSAAVDPELPVTRFELTFGQNVLPKFWFDLVFARDMTFLNW